MKEEEPTLAACLLAGDQSCSVICKWKALMLAIIDNSEIEKQIVFLT
jgi:hypothetical protein